MTTTSQVLELFSFIRVLVMHAGIPPGTLCDAR